MDNVYNIQSYLSQYRDHYINLLQEWVQHPTLSGEEYELQQKIAVRLENTGFEVDMWEPDI